jgi:hypothetical protein
MKKNSKTGTMCILELDKLDLIRNFDFRAKQVFDNVSPVLKKGPL